MPKLAKWQERDIYSKLMEHRNRDQREGEGRMGKKKKGQRNRVNNIVVSLHGDRWLQE